MLRPKVIYIETTNLCNAKCIMCPHENMTRKKGFMSKKIFEKIIEDCKEVDLREGQVFLHKEGEPLLDPFIIDRIRYAKDNLPEVKEIGINTNAMLLNEEISRNLIKSGLDTIYFSVDGASPETYNKIRINLDYNTVEDNIKTFFKIKEEMGSNIKVIMQMLVYEDNKDEIDKFKELWKDKASEFYIKVMHSYLDGGMSTITEKLSVEQIKICKDPFEIIVLFCDGSAGMCCWDYDNFIHIGNVMDNTIMELFNNEVFTKIRRLHNEKKCNELEPCNRCSRVFGLDEICSYE